MPVAFLVLALVAGTGTTYLSGLDLDLEERVAYGAVIGLMTAGVAGFAIALVAGVGPTATLAGLAVALAAGAAGWWPALRRLREEVAATAPARLLPVALLFVVCGIYTTVLMTGAYVQRAGGLEVWSIGVYGDWAAHLTYAGSFAYGNNLPPEYPIAPGLRLGYPFMVDFLAAELVTLGAGLTQGLVLTSGYLLLAFPAVMYLAARRLAGGVLGPVLGVAVFLMGGGLGFATLHDTRLSTMEVSQNYQWLNPVLAYLLPQRSILFGLAIALIAAALLVAARQQPGWRPFVFTGVLVGLAPAFHVHGYGTAVALPAFWALADRRPAWLGYFAPALALGVPALVWLVQPGAAVVRWEVGWMAGSDSWLWFWLKNTGLFIPLLLIAQLWPGVAGGFRLLFAPMWLWFAVPNLVVFQPWDWDNTKFFVFWNLFGAILVGALLAHVVRQGVGPALLAMGALVLLSASGGLDLARLVAPADRSIFTDRGGQAVAAWAQTHTDAHAVFLVAPEHNEPVPVFGGRRVVAGYPGWLWSYGIPDWAERVQAEKEMLAGTRPPAADASYVVVGPQERALGATDAYWGAHGALVYSGGGYSVYRLARG